MRACEHEHGFDGPKLSGSVAFSPPSRPPRRKGRAGGGARSHTLSRREPHDQRAGAECAPAPAVSAMDSRPTVASDSHPEKGSSLCTSRMPFCGVVRRSMFVFNGSESSDKSSPGSSSVSLGYTHLGYGWHTELAD